jgi:radical SAM superfamily enzyme YgiQ (UPF0313 family)
MKERSSGLTFDRAVAKPPVVVMLFLKFVVSACVRNCQFCQSRREFVKPYPKVIERAEIWVALVHASQEYDN